MKSLIALVIFIMAFQISYAQNKLQKDKTWLVYENKGKGIVEQIIIKADNPDFFYQSTRFKLTKMIKNEGRSAENTHIYTLEGQKGEYTFMMGNPIMIARPEISNKITWEVHGNLTRVNPDGSKSIFKLKNVNY